MVQEKRIAIEDSRAITRGRKTVCCERRNCCPIGFQFKSFHYIQFHSLHMIHLLLLGILLKGNWYFRIRILILVTMACLSVRPGLGSLCWLLDYSVICQLFMDSATDWVCFVPRSWILECPLLTMYLRGHFWLLLYFYAYFKLVEPIYFLKNLTCAC